MQIIVWTLDPEAAADRAHPIFDNLLDASERARAALFVHDRNRREFRAAHALKRAAIALLSGVTPAECRFEVEDGGKPVLAHPRGLHFNLSHCKGLVAVAACTDTPVGVDVEPTASTWPFEIASAVFAPSELAWLETLTPAGRQEEAVRLWTLKEAFIKATGRGLAEPLDGFSFSFDRLAIQFQSPARWSSQAWRFAERRLARHQLALAWRGPSNACLTLREIRYDDPMFCAWQGY